MQTPFVTDLTAAALPATSGNAATAPVVLRFVDQHGTQVGTAIVDAGTLHAAGRDLIAIAEAASLAAAAPAHHARPPRKHIALMRDVRVAEAV